MDLLFITHLLNGLLMVGMPVGLGIYLTRRFHLGWRLWGIGAATFVLSQVGHLPFNSGLNFLIQRGFLPTFSGMWGLVFVAIIFGLSAGLWEEGTRYAVFRWWAKDARSWRKAILMGAGHGGMEAIIFGLLVVYTFFIMVYARSAGLSSLVSEDQMALAQQQFNAYWSAPWYATLLGAVERAFSIPVQITLSVIILQTFTRRQIRWLWFAIGWHTLVDASSLVALRTWGTYPSEGLIGILSLLSIGMLFALRQPEPEPPSEEAPPLPEVKGFELPEVEATAENLENTRYN